MAGFAMVQPGIHLARKAVLGLRLLSDRGRPAESRLTGVDGLLLANHFTNSLFSFRADQGTGSGRLLVSDASASATSHHRQQRLAWGCPTTELLASLSSSSAQYLIQRALLESVPVPQDQVLAHLDPNAMSGLFNEWPFWIFRKLSLFDWKFCVFADGDPGRGLPLRQLR